MADNPYQDQTTVNTSTRWLDDQERVDLDLDGMAEYADHMKTIQSNLMHESGHLRDMSSLPMDAWTGPVLGEADYIRQRMGDNFIELQSYLQYLGTALQNIGMAAQTIADAYSSTDGWSAASLDAVNFAFADTGARRPPGLPSFITGETWQDKMAEAEQEADDAPPPESPQWGNPASWDSRTNADGGVTQTATAPGGQRMEITTSYSGGATITTTTIFAANGRRLSTSSQRVSTYSSGTFSSTTTSTTYNGRPTGSTRETTTYDGHGTATETTVNQDAQGQQTGRSQTVTETEDSGAQTVTTTDDEGHVTNEVAVGPQTQGGPSNPDHGPYQRTLDDIEDMY